MTDEDIKRNLLKYVADLRSGHATIQSDDSDSSSARQPSSSSGPIPNSSDSADPPRSQPLIFTEIQNASNSTGSDSDDLVTCFNRLLRLDRQELVNCALNLKEKLPLANTLVIPELWVDEEILTVAKHLENHLTALRAMRNDFSTSFHRLFDLADSTSFLPLLDLGPDDWDRLERSLNQLITILGSLDTKLFEIGKARGMEPF